MDVLYVHLSKLEKCFIWNATLHHAICLSFTCFEKTKQTRADLDEIPFSCKINQSGLEETFSYKKIATRVS